MTDNNNMYQKGKIYRLVCNTTGLQYYGSTCEDMLCKRLTKHKANYNQFIKNEHDFTTSFDIIKNNNYEIILVENYPCNSKDELHQRERFHIENNDCINKVIPCRTSNEYYEDNKDKIQERHKKWSEENKDKMDDYYKNYRDENKDKIKKYRDENKEKNKERKKKYYEENKDKILLKRKQYREENKDKIREQKKSIVKKLN